jgi:hypothetical protein
VTSSKDTSSKDASSKDTSVAHIVVEGGFSEVLCCCVHLYMISSLMLRSEVLYVYTHAHTRTHTHTHTHTVLLCACVFVIQCNTSKRSFVCKKPQED